MPAPLLGSSPDAICTPGSELGSVVKLVVVQPAVAPRLAPVVVAAEHFRLTADVGTVVQPVNVDALAPTLSVQVRWLWVFNENVTVADALPATVDPGLFAVKEIVAGVAVNDSAFCAATDWVG
jgi:hypothetical protein